MNRPVAIALSLLTALLFGAGMLLLTDPLLRSGDDAYVMYRLSGAFGLPAQPLHGYQHLWHLLLAAPVSALFGVWPGVNWYTVALLAALAAGSGFMGALWLRRWGHYGWVPYGLMILFFGSSQVLHLNFTGTSLWLAGAGAVGLFDALKRPRGAGRGAFVISFVLLLWAGLLRFHVTGLVLVLFLPLYATAWRSPRRWAVAGGLLLLGISLVGLYAFQEARYVAADPAWKAQEGYRQAFFYKSNRPVVAQPERSPIYSDSTEAALHGRHFIYDTAQFSRERLQVLNRALVRSRSGSEAEDRLALYWIFMESRLYLLLLVAVLLVGAGRKGGRRQMGMIVLSFLLLYAVLFHWFKITTVLHLGFLFLLHLQLLLLWPEGWWRLRREVAAAALVGLAALAWKGVHLRREALENPLLADWFFCMQSGLAAHPGVLFIATDDRLPLSYFPVEVSPLRYPVTNLLNRDRHITFSAAPMLQRFGVNGLWTALVQRKDILLVGPSFPGLEAYYRLHRGELVRMSPPLAGFGCLEVRRLSAAGR